MKIYSLSVQRKKRNIISLSNISLYKLHWLKSNIKNKLYILFISSLLLFSSSVKGQSLFHIILDYHYNLGLNEKGYHYSYYRGEWKMYGKSLHISALHDFSPRLSLGAGMGLDRYENPGYNTFPIFLTGQYFPMTGNLINSYLFTNIGYAIGSEKHFNQGYLWDIGIGYKKMFKKHFGLNFQLGYNLKQIKDIPFYVFQESANNNNEYSITYIGEKNSIRHSITIGIGLIF